MSEEQESAGFRRRHDNYKSSMDHTLERMRRIRQKAQQASRQRREKLDRKRFQLMMDHGHGSEDNNDTKNNQQLTIPTPEQFCSIFDQKDQQLMEKALLAIRKRSSQQGGGSALRPYLKEDIMSKLHTLLKTSNTKIQADTLWIITNMTAWSEAFVLAIEQSGIMKTLVDFFREGGSTARDACFALSNICLESSYYRDSVLDMGISKIVANLDITKLDPKTVETISFLIYALCNSCYDAAPEHYLIELEPVMNKLLTCPSKNVVSSCLKSYADVLRTRRDHKLHHIFSQHDAPQKMSDILKPNSPRFNHENALLALDALSMFIEADEQTTSLVFECDILDNIARLLEHKCDDTQQREIRAKITFMLSNATVGSKHRTMAIMNHPAVILKNLSSVLHYEYADAQKTKVDFFYIILHVIVCLDLDDMMRFVREYQVIEQAVKHFNLLDPKHHSILFDVIMNVAVDLKMAGREQQVRHIEQMIDQKVRFKTFGQYLDRIYEPTQCSYEKCEAMLTFFGRQPNRNHPSLDATEFVDHHDTNEFIF